MAMRTFVGTDGNYANTANWVEGAVPVAGDDVVISSGAISSNLNQSSVALNSFTVSASNTSTIGSQGARLQISTSSFTFSGGGKSYFDLGASAITPRIVRTGGSSAGQAAVDLIGSAMTGLRVDSGSVDIAMKHGETATVATVQNINGAVRIGSGVTLTTYQQTAGSGEINCAATTVTANGGTLNIFGSGAITTLNNNGANIVASSTGTITTLNNNAGSTDFSQSQTARTVTTPTIGGGSIKVDPNVMTFTNKLALGKLLTVTAS